jgi:hypothetical protein
MRSYSAGEQPGVKNLTPWASLLIPMVLPLARVARLALVPVSLERIAVAEAAYTPNGL